MTSLWSSYFSPCFSYYEEKEMSLKAQFSVFRETEAWPVSLLCWYWAADFQMQLHEVGAVLHLLAVSGYSAFLSSQIYFLAPDKDIEAPFWLPP